jgi:two-component system response regulator YesN
MHTAGHNKPRDPEHLGIKEAKTFVDQHLSEQATTRAIARHVGLSEAHFCRVFRKCTGTTFLDYVHRVRIDAAKQLLTDPSLRVKEIAHALGFRTVSHFNHKFRQHTGASPREHRAKIGQEKSKSNKLSGSPARLRRP